jgi:hypothetical protein
MTLLVVQHEHGCRRLAGLLARAGVLQ